MWAPHHGTSCPELLSARWSGPAPCDPMDCSPPGSSVHGMLQARALERVARPSSRGASCPRGRTLLACSAAGLYHLSHQEGLEEGAKGLIRMGWPGSEEGTNWAERGMEEEPQDAIGDLRS